MKPKLLTAFLVISLLTVLTCPVFGKGFQKIYSEAEFACWVTTFFGAEGKTVSNLPTRTVIVTSGSCFAVNFDSKTYIVTSAHLSRFDREDALDFINENMVIDPVLRWTEVSSMTIVKTFVIFKSTKNISLANASEDINAGYLKANAPITAKFEKADYENDLVQLKPEDAAAYKKIKTGTFGDSDRLLIGEEVMAIGNPLDHTFIPSWGQISHFHIDKNGNKIYRHIFTSEMAGSGNSGGPLLNRKGEIVGICKGSYFTNPHFGIFVPSNDIKDYLKSH